MGEFPGGGGRGAGRVSAANLEFLGGGGLNIFFRGRNVHQDVFARFQGKDPVLPFLVVLEKGTENHQKNKDFFSPAEPLKSLEKKGKTLKKTRNSSQGKKTRNSKKARKGRTGERPKWLRERQERQESLRNPLRIRRPKRQNKTS